jgi:hypothetical protein
LRRPDAAGEHREDTGIAAPKQMVPGRFLFRQINPLFG